MQLDWNKVDIISKKPRGAIKISNIPISERGKGNKQTNGGDLALLPRPDHYKIFKTKCTSLNPPAIELYRKFVARFGLDNLVSWPQIKVAFPHLNHFHLASYFPQLWINGYVDKYARGRWGSSKRGGKYHGVHYVARRVIA